MPFTEQELAEMRAREHPMSRKRGPDSRVHPDNECIVEVLLLDKRAMTEDQISGDDNPRIESIVARFSFVESEHDEPGDARLTAENMMVRLSARKPGKDTEMIGDLT